MTDPKYQAFTIELTWNRGEWHATVTRRKDGEHRYYHHSSVTLLLDVDVAGFVGGYDD